MAHCQLLQYSDEVDMNDRILGELRLYLIGEIDFETLEDRVIPLAWAPSATIEI